MILFGFIFVTHFLNQHRKAILQEDRADRVALSFRGPGLIVLFSLLTLVSGCHHLAYINHENFQRTNRLKTLAKSAEEQNQFHQAAEIWQQASETAQDDGSCSLRCAENFCKNEKFQDAITVLSQALKKNPDNMEIYLALAEIELKSGNRIRAEKTLKEALAREPDNIKALTLQARVAHLQKRFHYEGELYHRILSVNPELVRAQLSLANWYLENGKSEQAEVLLRNILLSHNASGDEEKEARWMTGILYGQKMQWGDSVVLLSSVIDQKECQSAEDWYRLAYACFRNHQIPEAREYLDKSLELNPSGQNALSLQKKLQSGAGYSIELVSYEDNGNDKIRPPRFWE